MLDWKRIESLRAEVGDDGFDEVVELFLEEIEEVAGRLRQPQGAGTPADDLHLLKGLSLNLGFSALGDLCQKGERGAAVDLAGLLACYAASRRQFLARLRPAA